MRAVLAGLLLLVAACAPATTAGTAVTPTFYRDPDTAATRQEAAWRTGGRSADADQIDKIARQPQAEWITDADPAQAENHSHDITARATAAHQTAVLVAYNIPGRDCGAYSGGGATTATAYRAWIAALQRGIGQTHPVIVLEPDAVAAALTQCLSQPQRAERLALLADAGAALAQTGARVYLDAGNPGWVTDTTALAGALRTAGVAGLAGFSLNVSNFYPTPDVETYGHDLSGKLGGAHFVVDTSRNGNGHPPDNGTNTWCNPPGRALGQPPTTTTGDTAVDALLWIKTPGESDGACHPGEPPAGQWWPDYALALAKDTP